MAPSAITTELPSDGNLVLKTIKTAPKVTRQIDIEGGTTKAKVNLLLPRFILSPG